MGISLNTNNAFNITDRFGNTKFSLDKRMPHIIGDFSGTVSPPLIYTSGISFTIPIINRIDIVAILSASNISTNLEDSFILPFYSITGGWADTGTNIISGTGSTIIRKIFQPTTREYLGCSILDIVQDNGSLNIICSNHIDKTGFNNIDGDVPVTISYRIYYGRFK